MSPESSRREADKRSNLTGAPKMPDCPVGLATGQGLENMAPGTSIFDPVLCELAYRWFCPPVGLVLDPFAGGSVRGIVASVLGRKYIGIDLRQEQITSNEKNWEEIKATGHRLEIAESSPDNRREVTPIEAVGHWWVKRDDVYSVAGVCGGKSRTCWFLSQGAKGLVTAGSRASPQVNIVAHIAQRLGIPCRVHTPTGALSPEVQSAQNVGAEVIQHKAGYNNVIIARAKEDAEARKWTYIPFGMECKEAIEQTRKQVRDFPQGVKRVLIPVGSGMSLAGVLWGMKDRDLRIPVTGVVVGADPEKRLDEYAPGDWREMVTLVKSESDYHEEAPEKQINGIPLDPHYEAKCLPLLCPGDLFWIVGIRQTEKTQKRPIGASADPRWICGDSSDVINLAHGAGADLVFSCPPYADLELYSEDPRDISNMDYPQFLEAYRGIIQKSCSLLRDDRFACFVVGEVRDRKGIYRNLVGDTVRAFLDAGLKYYNEAILVTAVGSLPIRSGRAFAAGRKLGKTHQNVLVFVKGDPKLATAACGEVEVHFPDAGPEAELQQESSS